MEWEWKGTDGFVAAIVVVLIDRVAIFFLISHLFL